MTDPEFRLERLVETHDVSGFSSGNAELDGWLQRHALAPVDQPNQGHGLGSRLLAEALRKAVTAGEAAAARLVVVDAIGAAYYERHGFIAVPDHPRRLYRRMKDVRASLDRSSL